MTENRVIAVNNASFETGKSKNTLCYSADLSWWRAYHHLVLQPPSQRWSCNAEAVRFYGLNKHERFPGGFNSGQQAIHLAAALGARRIILLGYDCSVRNGHHFHGVHKFGLSNPGINTTLEWQHQFLRLALSLPHVDIINCSRYTELICFKTKKIDDVF